MTTKRWSTETKDSEEIERPRKDTVKADGRRNKACSVGGLTGESRVGAAERWCTRRCQPGRDVELEKKSK